MHVLNEVFNLKFALIISRLIEKSNIAFFLTSFICLSVELDNRLFLEIILIISEDAILLRIHEISAFRIYVSLYHFDSVKFLKEHQFKELKWPETSPRFVTIVKSYKCYVGEVIIYKFVFLRKRLFRH